MRRMWTRGLVVAALGLLGGAGLQAQSATARVDRVRAEMELREAAARAELRGTRTEIALSRAQSAATLRAVEAELAQVRAVGLATTRSALRASAAEVARVTAEVDAVASATVARSLGSMSQRSARAGAELRAAERAIAQQGAALRSRVARGAAVEARALEPRPEERVPEAWLPQDPADSLYRAARARLNDRRYAEAARTFASIRSDYPRSGYVGDTFYFEALARSRVGGQDQLRTALELLTVQRREHAQAATVSDARALQVRIESELARRGDAQAAQSIMGVAQGAGQGRGSNSSSASQGQVACDEEEQAMRATALSALLHLDPERARPILQEVLRTRDECAAELRAQAVFILADQGGDDPATVDLLLDLAHRNPDPDPEVREAAVFWLSQTGRDEAVDALIEILRSGTADTEVAEQAIFALGQTGNPRAFETLRDFAADSDADLELREGAIFWLGQHDQGGAGFLRSLYSSLDDADLKEGVLHSVAQSGTPEAMEWLMGRALDPQEDIEVRKTALFWAGQAGLTPAQALDLYRSSTDTELREQAIFVLTQVADDGEAVEALMEIARTEENPELRQNAVFWLGQSDDPRVVEFLMELIRGGGDR